MSENKLIMRVKFKELPDLGWLNVFHEPLNYKPCDTCAVYINNSCAEPEKQGVKCCTDFLGRYEKVKQ